MPSVFVPCCEGYKECEWCGKTFADMTADLTQTHCSIECELDKLANCISHLGNRKEHRVD